MVTSEPITEDNSLALNKVAAPQAQPPAKRERRVTNGHDETTWNPPDVSALQNRYGSSVLDQFVSAHSTSDIVTELIQNEFDAEGSSVKINLRSNRVEITGNGKIISAKGWKRLNVVLGTGETVGLDGSVEEVTPKEGGIGSKNFGLRSLFQIGDKIYIRSGGKFTLKDRFSGSPPRPLPDPSSKDLPGVAIDVPFRDAQSGRLEAFTIERETEMLDLLLENLRYTVVKLSLPGSPLNIQRVEVKSERLDRRIIWKQKAERIGVRRRDSATFQRTVHVQESLPGRSVSNKIALQELEFTKNVPVPEKFQNEEIAKYFRRPSGRVRIGVSLRMSKGKVDLEHNGLFFYPLGLRNGLTGTAISVNAPFVLSPDRSHIIEIEWNNWLFECAADLTMELLNTEWRDRFGPEAFLTLRKLSKPACPRFLERIDEHLSKDSCWPTRAQKDGEPVLVAASELIIPTQKEFDNFLASIRYLDNFFETKNCDEEIKKLAQGHGAKLFTLDSLVYLRCTREHGDLDTKIEDQAGYRYSDYQAALGKREVQQKFAQALDVSRSRLTKNHKNDLQNSPTTLAADGSLQAAMDLTCVDPVIWDACPVPLARRLEPTLLPYKAITDRCITFEENRWALDVGTRIDDGTANLDEQQALYEFILVRHSNLRANVINALKNTPVLKDQRGNWVEPHDLLSKQAKGLRGLLPILRFPNHEFAADRELESRFKFRKEVRGTDLVLMAEFVSSNPDQAESFQRALHRHRGLLDKSIVSELNEIAFLPSSAGNLKAPQYLYIRNAANEAALGQSVEYLAGNRTELYRKLGCSEFPTVPDIIGHLEGLREEGHRPDRLEAIYTALVGAIKSEGRDTSEFAEESIIWTEDGFRPPVDVLVGTRFPQYFRSAVPYVASPKGLVEALQELGANPQPSSRQRMEMFSWLERKYVQAGETVSNRDRITFRDMYAKLGAAGLPVETGVKLRYLLGQDRKLYSLTDVSNKRFVWNDYPELAEAITEQGAPVAFADSDEKSQEFFNSLDLTALTSMARNPQPMIGEERDPPKAFNLTKILDKLNSKDFASAVAAIGLAEARINPGFKLVMTSTIAGRLASIARIVFVQQLEVVYRIRRTEVSVGQEVWLGDDQISMIRVRSPREINQLLAIGLTHIISASTMDRQRIADPILFLLLCQSSKEIENYLRRRGINWTPPNNDMIDDEIDDEADINDSLGGDDNQTLIANIAKREQGRTDIPNSSETPVNGGGQGIEQSRGGGLEPSQASPIVLPAVETVILQPATVSGNWTPNERSTSGGGRGGSWTPRTAIEAENDEAVGLRGEELVFEAERKRVQELGFDENRVVWTAKLNRTADHDIKSVGEDGKVIWIEVKSTVGRDGRFPWSIGEFGKAAREQDRYELWRVYEATSDAPKFKKFQNPVAMHQQKKIKVDVASFWTEVEPMNA